MSLITFNKKAYTICFGIKSLIMLDEISYITDKRELLKQQFCISNIAELDNTPLLFEEKALIFDTYIKDGLDCQMIEEVLSEAIAQSLGEYKEMTQELYNELFSKGIGEIGLTVDEFNSMTPVEIDLAYQGYLQRLETQANCILIAIRKSKNNKATLISLSGGDGYKHISNTERENVLETLNIN